MTKPRSSTPAVPLSPREDLAARIRAYGQACADQAVAALEHDTVRVERLRKRREGILRRAVQLLPADRPARDESP